MRADEFRREVLVSIIFTMDPFDLVSVLL